MLDQRDDRAITLSFFQTELEHSYDTSKRLALARLLSLIHLRHYVDHIGADIATGIRHLVYFDSSAYTFPLLDLALLTAVFKYLRISLLNLATPRELETVIALRRTEQHKRFVAAIRFLLNAAVYRVWRNTGTSNLLRHRELLASALDTLLLGGRWRPPVTNNIASHFDRLTAELERLALVSTQSADIAEFSTLFRHEVAMSTKRILILTATGLETRTILENVRIQFGVSVTRTYMNDHTVHLCGHLGQCDVFLVQSEMGTESPSAMTLTAIDVVDALMPDSVILVGIAFGLRPDKQQIGDVLISKQMCLYDPKKLVETEGREVWLARGDRPQASPRLLDRFRSGSLDWPTATVHFGLLLSGNTLVNSQSFIEALKKVEPEAIGGEMEGAGVYAVGAKRKVDWIVVKGVADWGTQKSDDGQQLAAANATAIVLHVIATGALAV